MTLAADLAAVYASMASAGMACAAVLVPQAGGSSVGGSALVLTAGDVLHGGAIVIEAPSLRAPAALLHVAREGDVVTLSGGPRAADAGDWRLAGRPVAIGDGLEMVAPIVRIA